jgi:uncharacterized protein YndB with AHSA1/START domain
MDRIEKDVLIAAPVERVWELITTAEHLGRWFGDAGAEIDLRPGGALVLRWQRDGPVHGRVEAVEPPRRFAFRWVLAGEPAADPTPANSTLTEFTLDVEGEATRVTVVESGFDGLDVEAADRATLLASHTSGWDAELGELAGHARGAAAER